ncbi:MAG: hypothetical protein AAGN66_05490 [Acidobacteriota bacterium]
MEQARVAAGTDPDALADWALRRASLLDDQAEPELAERLARKALRVFSETGSSRFWPGTVNLAVFLANQGELEGAVETLETALPHISPDGGRHHYAIVHNLAVYRARLGRSNGLRQLIAETSRILSSSGAEPGVVGRFEWAAAEAFYCIGDLPEAIRRFQHSWEQLSSAQLWPDAALAAIDEMESHLSRGEDRKGIHGASGRVFLALRNIEDSGLGSALRSLLKQVAARAISLEVLEATRRRMRRRL